MQPSERSLLPLETSIHPFLAGLMSWLLSTIEQLLWINFLLLTLLLMILI